MTQETDTKTALLHAAEELFSARGYDAVGTRDIATRAGTNISSIKYHFGSKRQLYLETIRWLLQHPDIQPNWDSFKTAPSTPRASAELLVGFIYGVLAEAAAGGRAERCVRLMLKESLRPGEDFEFIAANFSAPYERSMIDLVRVIAPGHSEIFYVTSGRSIFAQVLHYYVWKSFLQCSEFGGLGQAIPVESAAREVATFVLRGLGCSETLIKKAVATVSAPSLNERSDSPL